MRPEVFEVFADEVHTAAHLAEIEAHTIFSGKLNRRE